MRHVVLFAVSLLVLGVSWGCDRNAQASDPPGTTAPPPAPAAPVASDPAGAGAVSTPASPVARIVFLDKEHPCHCTQGAMDASWAALQEALAGASIPVERIHSDTQEAQAAPYRAMQAMMAVPGIYFLDAAGGLVGMLQGEVTAEQVRAILHPAA